MSSRVGASPQTAWWLTQRPPEQLYETSSLLLRRRHVDDTPHFYEEATTTSLEHLTETIPHVVPASIDTATEYYKKSDEDWDNYVAYHYSMFASPSMANKGRGLSASAAPRTLGPGGKVFAGSISLFARRGVGALEVGFWVAKPFCRMGLATLSSHRIIAAAFKLLEVDSVELLHSPNLEQSSGGVARNLRFQRFQAPEVYSPDSLHSTRRHSNAATLVVWTMSRGEWERDDEDERNDESDNKKEAYDMRGPSSQLSNQSDQSDDSKDKDLRSLRSPSLTLKRLSLGRVEGYEATGSGPASQLSQQSDSTDASLNIGSPGGGVNFYDELAIIEPRLGVSQHKIITKWRVKRRAGYKKKHRRSSLTMDEEEVNSMAMDVGRSGGTDIVPGMFEEDEGAEKSPEQEEYDSRIGDAEDRINDIHHLLETGEDVDYEDYSYQTQYVVVKPKKPSFWRSNHWFAKLLRCGKKPKRRKLTFQDK